MEGNQRNHNPQAAAAAAAAKRRELNGRIGQFCIVSNWIMRDVIMDHVVKSTQDATINFQIVDVLWTRARAQE